MESPAEAAAAAAAAADPSTCTFIQVIFNDIPHSYPPSSPITCRYTLTQAFQSHSRDWVGIFKVGWSTTKDYHTFVWVEPCQDVERQGSVTREAVFKEYYLPKDDIDFYQFCYIDSTGQVRGASTPFCFKKPEGQSMDSSPEDDLLVITTQEQVEQSIREKAELQRELDRMREENEKLKRVVQMERQEATILKWQRDEKEKDKNLLVVELDQVKEQNQNVQSTLEQQLQEMATLKEELLTHRAKQVEIQQQREGALKETEMKEKYDQAMAKISRFIEENKELKGRIDVQSEEIAKLNCKRREDERELLKTKDINLLLQVDVQSSENENERLAAELQRLQSVICKMEDLKSENKELCRRLSEQETGHTDCPDSDLRVECQALVSQLQDAQARLAAEREESKKAKIHAEVHYRELTSTVKQLETVVASYDMEQQKSNKLELQFREALESIGDKDAVIEEMEHMMRLVKHENEELASENQNLRIEIEGLRRVYSDLHTPPSGEEPDATSPAGNTSTHGWQQQQETPDQTEEPYEPIGSIAGPEEEQSLVCRHCQESFPGITRGELEQHEQSHRVCPFCTMICDNMEQSVFEDHVYSHEL